MVSVTVNTVIKNLSAMGSITLPTTVCNMKRRAIQPSTISVIPAYANRPSAYLCCPCNTRYPMTGAAKRRVAVKKLGML